MRCGGQSFACLLLCASLLLFETRSHIEPEAHWSASPGNLPVFACPVLVYTTVPGFYVNTGDLNWVLTQQNLAN